MEGDKIWNKPSAKDQQLVLLNSLLTKFVNNVNGAISSQEQTKPTDTKPKDGNPKEPRKSKVPSWKYERKDDETECERDDKTWYWCPHHPNPNGGDPGMWVRHKPEEHMNGFKQGGSNRSSNDRNKGNQPSTANTANSASNNSKPSVTIDTKLFQALKSGADIQVFLNKMTGQTNETLLN